MKPFPSNLHTHTTHSDGTSTAAEYVQAALDLGFVSLGISDHAYAHYDTGCCMKEDALPGYIAELTALRRQYADQLEIYIGLETDYFSANSRDGLDYVVGSAHYIREEGNGAYWPMDNTPEIFADALKQAAGGDIRKLTKMYYSVVAEMVERQRPDIVGHLDIITKFNPDNCYFDAGSRWYLVIISEVVEAIKKAGCIVEISTGGMIRGYTSCPYPAQPILKLLFAAGVPMTISSDAHGAAKLDAYFNRAAVQLLEAGYKSIMQMQKGGFVEVALA